MTAPISSQAPEPGDAFFKAAFLSNVSHELRTPMNGIMGFADLLKDPRLSPQNRETYLNIIISCSHQLLTVIDDLLTLAQTETSQLVAHNSPENRPSVFENIHHHFTAKINERKNAAAISTNPNQ